MFTNVNGFKMAYEMKGIGFPVLLIHGFPLSKEMWKPQLEELSKYAQVITPDLRGFGDSQEATGTCTMEMYADDCIALLDALQISGKVIIGGLSMGGYITMAICRKYPDRLAGIILAATRAGADSEESRANRDHWIAITQEKGSRAMSEIMLPKLLAPYTLSEQPQIVELVRSITEKASVGGIVAALQGMKIRPDSTPTLPHIKVPALIIHGVDDQLFPPSEAESMYKAIPHSQYVLISGAGHMPNLEQREKFNQSVKEFIRGVIS